jgi:hypothetical protein
VCILSDTQDVIEVGENSALQTAIVDAICITLTAYAPKAEFTTVGAATGH